jgi:hypothetical protein
VRPTALQMLTRRLCLAGVIACLAPEGIKIFGGTPPKGDDDGTR